VRLFRAKATRIAFRESIFSSGDGQLDLSFEDISEFFALVFENAAGPAAWHGVVEMAFQEMGARIISKRLDLIAVSVRLEFQSLRRSHYEVVGIHFLSKKLAHGEAQSRSQLMQHFN
jgi:hypothetical protein